MIALPVLVLVVALVFGVPIAVALAGSGMLGIYLVTGDVGKVMGILSLAPFSTVADYALTTIPMFILMAFFSASSGLARDLYTAASNWCSHIKGGLAIATVFACGIFGAMSGASTAAASVMSKIAMPEMRRHGYSDELAAGAIGIGATIFGYYMALSRIPQDMVSAVTAMDLNRWVVIIGIVVAYFIISMFMDEIPLLLLTLQLTFPLITSLGFDPIWFGVLSMMMVSMGLVFPPVGLIAFVVSATADVDLMKVYKGTSILMMSIVITTILLMIFPQIALWLPATMR